MPLNTVYASPYADLNSSSGVGTRTISAPAVGHSIILPIWTGDPAVTVVSVVDNQGNIYSRHGTPFNMGSYDFEIWYLSNVQNAPTTITYNLSTTGMYSFGSAYVVDGPIVPAIAIDDNSNNNTTPTATIVTTTADNWVVMATFSNFARVWSAPTLGFTLLDDVNSIAVNDIYKSNVGPAGTYSPEVTMSAGNFWLNGTASFRPVKTHPVVLGTPAEIVWASGGSPAAQNITPPAGTKLVCVQWSFYVGTNDSSVSAITLDGNAPDQIFQINTVTPDNIATGVAIWKNPPTGSPIPLSIAFTTGPTEGPITTVTYLARCATGGWRDADAAHVNGATQQTINVDTKPEDLVLVLDQKYLSPLPANEAGYTSLRTLSNVQEFARLRFIIADDLSMAASTQDTNYSSIVGVVIRKLDNQKYGYGPVPAQKAILVR